MKFKVTTMIMICGVIALGFGTSSALAAEVITKPDFIDKVITSNLVKTADNFIILFNAASSTKKPYLNTGESILQVSKRELKVRNEMVPALGYNAGLYLYTPFKEVYPMQPYNREKMDAAIDQLPDEGKGPSLLMQGLIKIEPVLKEASGRTAVFVFSDGEYAEFAGFRNPEAKIKEMSAKYNVCFYFVSYADPGNKKAQKNLRDLASGSECSRVLWFSEYVERLEYFTGPLFVVRAGEPGITETEQKPVVLKVKNIGFEFDAHKIEPGYYSILDQLGDFLNKHPQTYIVIDGYTDDRGNFEYNRRLARQRAQSVAEYLGYKHNIDSDRMVVQWFGALNPIAGNDTDEGRALNRRVEIAVGGSD